MNPIKKSNRTRILEYIFRNAPVSRATIAEQTDITPATVTTTTMALVNEGIIVNLGEVEQVSDNTPGRKRQLLDLNADYAYAIGIEFNEKNIAFCITNLRGHIIDQKLVLTTYKEINNITAFILEEVEKLIQHNEGISGKLIGIGIGVPGKISRNKKELITDSKVWESFNPERIKEKFDVPIIMENNVRCKAFGEYLFRPLQTPEHFSFFHIGMGMYCANVINGELFEQENYISGEIGHTIVEVDGKLCECGKCGCLQTYASERWLIKAGKLLVKNKSSLILNSLVKEEEDVTIEKLISAYNLGDEIIRGYISKALKYLSMTVSNLSIVMNPTKIFLHGQLLGNQEILKEFQTYIEKDLNFMGNNYFENIEVLPYEPNNGAVGASARIIYTYFINE